MSLRHSVVYALLAVAIALASLNGVRPISGVTASDLFIVAALLSSAVLWRRGFFRAVPAQYYVAALLMVAAGVLSSAFAERITISTASFIQYFWAAFVFPTLIAYVSAKPQMLARFALVWLVFVVANVVIGLLDFFEITELAKAFDSATVNAGYWKRAYGFSVHPNHYALAAAMVLPVAIAFGSTARRFRRLLLVVCGAVLFVGILSSGSRTSLLTATIAMLGFCCMSRYAFKFCLQALVTVVLILMAFAIYQPDIFDLVSIGWERLAGDATAAGSDIQRVDLLQQALNDSIRDPLTGVGFEAIDEAHNIYLQVLHASGIVAFVAFVMYLNVIARISLTLMQMPFEFRHLQIIRALMLSVCVWLLNGLLQNQITDRYVYIPIGLLLGYWVLSSSVFTVRNSVRETPARP